MRKINFTLFIFAFCFVQVFSQSEQYTRIKGSTVSLVIPNGFVESERFAGIINSKNNASILLSEMELAFDGIATAYTKENLATKNIKFISKEEVTVDNKKGVLVLGEQTAYGLTFSKAILVLGEKTKTLIASGTYLKSDWKTVEPQIKKLLLNLKWNSETQISATEGINFSISETKKLKISSSISKSLILTLNGKLGVQDIEKPIFVVTEAISNFLTLDTKVFSEKRTKQYNHVSEVEIIDNKPITINGLDGYEIVFIGKDKRTGKKSFNYQVSLFKSNTYFLMVGTVLFDNKNEYIEDFKEVAKSFKLKNH